MSDTYRKALSDLLLKSQKCPYCKTKQVRKDAPEDRCTYVTCECPGRVIVEVRPTALPACETCGGRRMVDYFDRQRLVEDEEPCPDCVVGVPEKGET